MHKFLLLLLFLALFAEPVLFAQSTSDVIVPVTVTTSKSPASITLSFPATANATSTRIGKKLPNQTAWTYKYLPANTTSWKDTAVVVGVGYEYYVAKLANIAPITRYGLVYAGIELPAVAYRGKVVLVVDDALSAPLVTELERLVQDLRGDGWQVIRHDINTAKSSVPAVKALLQADYTADPDRTVAALLFGNIPVPYSGNINPDGHAEHQGAWPTDYYYSDLDGVWTDNSVNNTLANRAANRNVPDDGKFDQSQTPSFPEIVVSRVDFSNLAGWDVSQTELYRRYLNKNHAFRTGAYRPDNQTLVDDNFGYFGGEAFAQNGLNNGYALTGPNSVVQADFFNGTETQSYLLGYGCGNGNYTGASGVGSSPDFMTDSVNITFTLLFGSYFGDWDYENNPFMPSALASKGGILTCAWAGRPNWTLHHMGLGEPILLSTFWTWVNSFISPIPYPPNFGADLVHVGLLGDPTLRAHAVKPPASVAGKAACTEAQLSWTASTDNGIIGYAIYRAPALDSAFQFLTVVSDSLHYTDKAAATGPNFYQIRALRLETTPTGSYFNQSVGAPFKVDLSPQTYQISVLPTPVSCNGGNDGSLDLTLISGNATFQWSTGATTQDISGLTAGSYTLTVTRGDGCTDTHTYSILQPQPISKQVVVTPVVCFGESNGRVNVTVGGGTPGYSLVWSNGLTGPQINNLATGNYTVTITDSKGCTTTASASVNGPTDLFIPLTAIPVVCYGTSTGTIASAAGGGTPGYSYLWSTGATTAVLNNIPAGTYTLTLTDTKGCTKTATATVPSPAAITAQTTASPAGCAAASNGSISLAVNGGTPGYTFKWSTGATTQNLANVPAGTYTVTITDKAACTQTGTATVGLNFTLAVQASSTNITCFGLANGTASLSVSGGAPGYSYLWSNGKTTPTLSALAPGTYTATVNDQAGCSLTASATLTQPPALTASGQWDLVDCPNNLGTVRLNVGGGIPGYTFLWSNGMTTQNLNNVLPAAYMVTITDQTGCTQVATNTISQYVPLVTALNVAPAKCYGQSDGSIDLNVTGGNTPYAYLWSTGDSTPDLQGLPAAEYTVTVTDASNCTAVIHVPVTQPGELIVAPNIVLPTSCYGGSDGMLSVHVDGGTEPYSYLWSNGQKTNPLPGLSSGAYTVTVTDAHTCTKTATAAVPSPPAITAQASTTVAGCAGATNGSVSLLVNGGSPGYTFKWSTGATTQNLGNVAAGTYTVTITDKAGCTHTSTATVGLNSTLAVQASSVNINCFGLANGSASLDVSGGAPGYSYLWSNGKTTPALSALSPGIYTATVTDQVGCSLTASVTITQPQQALTATAFWELSDCANNLGAVTLTPGGGTPGYSYLWSTGSTIQNLPAVSPAIYTVTITDQNGCTLVTTNTIRVFLPLQATPIVEQVQCFGQGNGNIHLVVDGGNDPYAYAWSNGGTGATNPDLPAGIFTVTVTDMSGCTVVKAIPVTQPDELTLSQGIANPITCFGGSDGKLFINVDGGTGPFNYSWSNGQKTNPLVGLSSGAYSVTVVDTHGCTSEYDNMILTDPPVVIGVYKPWNPILCRGFATELQIDTIFGGAGGPYQFSLDFGVLFSVSTPVQLTGGVHTVSYFDRLGCFTADSILVDEPAGSGVFVEGNDSVCVNLPEIYSLQGNFTSAFWMIGNGGELVSGQGTGTAGVQWPGPGLNILSAIVGYGPGCTDTVTYTVFADICVGTFETALPGVLIRPNPFDTWLEIQFECPVAPGSRWRLTDLQGRMLQENTLDGRITRLDTGGLPAGAYLLQVLENGRSGVWKLVKVD